MAEFYDVFENRVRFAETDMQGVVFYGNYVTFQDETFNAFLREIDYGYDTFADKGWDVHVVHVDVDYHAPAKFDDVVVNAMRVAELGTKSITFAYRARKKADDTLFASGHVTHVAVSAQTGEAIAIPDDFREALLAFQETPPEVR
ncbi:MULTISPECIES: thioesterase family protein [unclassified Haladaptatus]|uniref:acyl-CoA thioesterase n=1 Tax=unclassified Haladaptatus TaxID=2622732 RepID=UPI0023E884D5|nr:MULTISPECIES: thioesterase family protein [unclassified Haladaptatus]